ncbi:protein-tyrosine phosphatase-like protein [Daedaleopsis nitida]|nr:protein-tyrosine phosphatase-like protein [Daedaleopsis nitida]
MATISIEVTPLSGSARHALSPLNNSPPLADTVVSMRRSATVDDDYFHRRALRKTCIQRSPVDDFFPQASEIVPGLFVCDLYTATSPAVIEQLGITHVVSVLRKPPYRYPRQIEHLCVPLEDRTDANLLDYLDYSVRWIRDALDVTTDDGGGRVLVHCVWGKSRSASLAVAFLVAARGMSLDAALHVVRTRRRVTRPNPGFVAQLQVYERVTRLREEQAQRLREEAARSASAPEEDLQLDALARHVAVIALS